MAQKTYKKQSTEIIRYNIPANLHQTFEKAYTDAGQFLKDSPFCLDYRVIHGEEEPNHYIVIINWTSTDEHINGFRNSEQFMPFFNLVKAFFGNIEEMKHYQELEIGFKDKNKNDL